MVDVYVVLSWKRTWYAFTATRNVEPEVDESLLPFVDLRFAEAHRGNIERRALSHRRENEKGSVDSCDSGREGWGDSPSGSRGGPMKRRKERERENKKGLFGLTGPSVARIRRRICALADSAVIFQAVRQFHSNEPD